jgi:hypothetical protein
VGLEARHRHQRGRRDRMTRSHPELRLADSEEAIRAALVLAREYGAWAVEVAKRNFGIDAEAESEHGFSTSIDELLVPRGRLYLAEEEGIPVWLGGLKPVSDEVAEIKRMYIRPSARGRGSADTCWSDCSPTPEHSNSSSSDWKAPPSCRRRTPSTEAQGSQPSHPSKDVSSPGFRARRKSESSWRFNSTTHRRCKPRLDQC